MGAEPRDRWSRALWLEATVAGLAGAVAFPLVIPPLAEVPLFDFLPRELAILVTAFCLARIAWAPAARRQRVLASFVGGVVHFAILLYWLDIAMVRYGRMPQWQALPALALLVIFCAAFWAALPAVVDLLRIVPRLGGALGFALAVVFLEWLRGVLFTGFPWGLWGYSQARNTPLLQLASLAGVYGISALVALSGALAARTTAEREQRRRLGVQLGGLVVGAHLLGALLWLAHQPDRGAGVAVALVQGNVEQNIKNRDELHRGEILARYLRLTQVAERHGVELVIWPEAAWPGKLDVTRPRLTELATHRRPLLFGASTYEWRGREARAFNSAFWAAPGGRLVARYDKQHLVPFGEYVPFRFVLPVEKLVPGMLDYSPGDSPRPLGTPPAGVLICYDGIFPEIAAAEVTAGARWLVNLTNDSWYGVSSAPYQHRDFYVLRAVETDRWIARVANAGISALVSPLGAVSHATDLELEALVLARIWSRDTMTVYVRAGDWLPAASIGGVLGALALRLVRWRRQAIDNTDRNGAQEAVPPSAAGSTELPPTPH